MTAPIRPPIGFVVEGVCEFQCYESIVRKGITASHGRIPVANAWGNGAIRKSLEAWLLEVVKAGYPCVVIVTLDVKEAIDEGAFAECAHLRSDLQTRADKWLEQARAIGTLRLLPERIVVVLQDPAFESWLTSDALGLEKYGLKKGCTPHCYSNVDTDIRRHKLWLEQNLADGYAKRPVDVRRIAKSLHPARMESCSRSFRKFWKEVRAAYADWQRITGVAYIEHSMAEI